MGTAALARDGDARDAIDNFYKLKTDRVCLFPVSAKTQLACCTRSSLKSYTKSSLVYNQRTWPNLAEWNVFAIAFGQASLA